MSNLLTKREKRRMQNNDNDKILNNHKKSENVLYFLKYEHYIQLDN